MAVGATLIAPSIQAQDVGKDVPSGHWAYQAVQDLASKGLIKGYPPDNNFVGKRTLTRYEMATIIQRVVARMDDLVKNVPAPAAGGVSQTDFNTLKASVGEIAALVDQFKTQLAVLGTDLDTVKSDLETLKGQIVDLSNKVNGFDDRLNGLSKKVDASNILADKALSNVAELKAGVNAALSHKVDIGVGSLKVGGIFQIWYGTAFGDTLGGNAHSNFGPAPTGRNYGGGVGDTFRLRRGEISLTGRITPQVDFGAMLDVTKSGTGSNSVLQDLWVGYKLARSLRFEVGQQKTGLSEEGTRSDAELLTVERSIMNTLPTTAGRVGDIRDTGAALRYHGPLFDGFVGVWNDNGNTQNLADNNRLKFVDGAIYFKGVRHLTVGIWGGTNAGDSRPAETRDRVGGTFLFQSGPHVFESEIAYARDYAAGAPGPGLSGAIARGGYFLYAYTLSRKWQFVTRYDNWDPSHKTNTDLQDQNTESGVPIFPYDHKLKEYTIGVNYYLRSHNAKIQLNYIREDTEQNGYNFFGKQRTILLSNFQVAF